MPFNPGDPYFNDTILLVLLGESSVGQVIDKSFYDHPININNLSISSQSVFAGTSVPVGQFDGSNIYGPYYQLFGNQYPNLSQRGGAEFVYDIRNNANANFHISSYNGSSKIATLSGLDINGNSVSYPTVDATSFYNVCPIFNSGTSGSYYVTSASGAGAASAATSSAGAATSSAAASCTNSSDIFVQVNRGRPFGFGLIISSLRFS